MTASPYQHLLELIGPDVKPNRAKRLSKAYELGQSCALAWISDWLGASGFEIDSPNPFADYIFNELVHTLDNLVRAVREEAAAEGIDEDDLRRNLVLYAKHQDTEASFIKFKNELGRIYSEGYANGALGEFKAANDLLKQMLDGDGSVRKTDTTDLATQLMEKEYERGREEEAAANAENGFTADLLQKSLTKANERGEKYRKLAEEMGDKIKELRGDPNQEAVVAALKVQHDRIVKLAKKFIENPTVAVINPNSQDIWDEFINIYQAGAAAQDNKNQRIEFKREQILAEMEDLKQHNKLLTRRLGGDAGPDWQTIARGYMVQRDRAEARVKELETAQSRTDTQTQERIKELEAALELYRTNPGVEIIEVADANVCSCGDGYNCYDGEIEVQGVTQLDWRAKALALGADYDPEYGEYARDKDGNWEYVGEDHPSRVKFLNDKAKYGA